MKISNKIHKIVTVACALFLLLLVSCEEFGETNVSREVGQSHQPPTAAKLYTDEYLPSEAFPRAMDWVDDDQVGLPGNIYKYQNPFTGYLEYFMLTMEARTKFSRSDSIPFSYDFVPRFKYSNFPIDQKDGKGWKYLGKKAKPPREVRYLSPYAYPDARDWTKFVEDRKDLQAQQAQMGVQFSASLIQAVLKFQLGDVFKYQNPHTGKLDYYMLTNIPSGSDRIPDLPTAGDALRFVDENTHSFWAHIGEKSPIKNKEIPSTDEYLPSDAFPHARNWVDDDQVGLPGNIYKYQNPFTGYLEYFMLTMEARTKFSRSDSIPFSYDFVPRFKYSNFPIDQKDGKGWKYLGKKAKPPRVIKYLATNAYPDARDWAKYIRRRNEIYAQVGYMPIYGNSMPGQIADMTLGEAKVRDVFKYLQPSTGDEVYYLLTDVPASIDEYELPNLPTAEKGDTNPIMTDSDGIKRSFWAYIGTKITRASLPTAVKKPVTSLTHEYLATDAYPDAHEWGDLINRLRPEDNIYKYQNPHSGYLEYFALTSQAWHDKVLNGIDLPKFPTNQKSNPDAWIYLGKKKPLKGDLLDSDAYPDAHEWGYRKNNRKFGDIYKGISTATNYMEYFKLMISWPVEHFPIDQKDNDSWEYLGKKPPREVSPVYPTAAVWDPVSGNNINEVYLRKNPDTGHWEYFKLIELDYDGKAGPFPPTRRHNYFWSYLGQRPSVAKVTEVEAVENLKVVGVTGNSIKISWKATLTSGRYGHYTVQYGKQGSPLQTSGQVLASNGSRRNIEKSFQYIIRGLEPRTAYTIVVFPKEQPAGLTPSEIRADRRQITATTTQSLSETLNKSGVTEQELKARYEADPAHFKKEVKNLSNAQSRVLSGILTAGAAAGTGTLLGMLGTTADFAAGGTILFETIWGAIRRTFAGGGTATETGGGVAAEATAGAGEVGLAGASFESGSTVTTGAGTVYSVKKLSDFVKVVVSELAYSAATIEAVTKFVNIMQDPSAAQGFVDFVNSGPMDNAGLKVLASGLKSGLVDPSKVKIDCDQFFKNNPAPMPSRTDVMGGTIEKDDTDEPKQRTYVPAQCQAESSQRGKRSINDWSLVPNRDTVSQLNNILPRQMGFLGIFHVSSGAGVGSAAINALRSAAEAVGAENRYSIQIHLFPGRTEKLPGMKKAQIVGILRVLLHSELTYDLKMGARLKKEFAGGRFSLRPSIGGQLIRNHGVEIPLIRNADDTGWEVYADGIQYLEEIVIRPIEVAYGFTTGNFTTKGTALIKSATKAAGKHTFEEATSQRVRKVNGLLGNLSSQFSFAIENGWHFRWSMANKKKALSALGLNFSVQILSHGLGSTVGMMMGAPVGKAATAGEITSFVAQTLALIAESAPKSALQPDKITGWLGVTAGLDNFANVKRNTLWTTTSPEFVRDLTGNSRNIMRIVTRQKLGHTVTQSPIDINGMALFRFYMVGNWQIYP